ncbi:divergent polysaccharide deacetylase family protein [Paenibacillaceae bacterium WGS1546]|uniref:divergent polysaccharide deacetylase family protein n=1 Tax=Cohnella sp. WGS1546 TaxID=3366810 RepID=UPI00372D499A
MLKKTKKRMLATALLLAAASLPCASIAQASAAEPSAPEPRRIAIVIDDLGNGMKGTEQIMQLPIKLTVAVMPFLPTTKRDAEEAHRRGHDVIVHLPMEPVKGKKSWLGPGAITTDLTDEEIRKRVEAAIADVPHAIGMNNHMGSKATADRRVMKVVLQVCKERGMFFLDSRTSYRTVVPKVAEELGVVTLRNDVFLDDVYTQSHVSRKISELKKLLGNTDRCIAIGHVGPPGLYTSGALKNAIPELKGRAAFVPISQLLPLPESFVHGQKLP